MPADNIDSPMMITVATKLDVPIKLSIPGPGKGSMLGLGDIVLPGIMMALALRFDLYMFYLRQAKTPALVSDPSLPAAFANHVQTISKSEPTKPTYIPATGAWGTSFWTRSIPKDKLPASLKAANFPKVYFFASIVGYVMGMCVTLGVLTIFKHGQPALLYLVPGVLGALWGTALVRGEVKEMWEYTEAGEKVDEEEQSKKEEKKDESGAVEKPEEKQEKVEKEAANEHAHHVFLFSLSWPRQGPRKRKGLLAPTRS